MIPSDEENIEWVRSFEAGEKWLKKLAVRKSGSEATERYYCRALKEFSEFSGKNPDLIIEEYKADIKEDLEEAMEKWSDILDSFAAHLMKRIKKSSTAVYHAAVKSFFNYNSRVELKAPTPEYYSERVPPVSFDELKELDSLADVQQRFFLRFLKDTGISRSDAVTLNYGDVKKEFEVNKQIIHVEMLRGKEKVEYDTFFGPNTAEALKSYLKLRETRGEEITDESPLFSSETVPYHRLSPQGLSAVFKRLSSKAGTKVTPHKLRKFFETYLALAKVHPVILKYWMGHKVGRGKKDVEMRYIIPPLDEQRKLYNDSYKKIDLKPPTVIEKEEVVKTVIEALPDELLRPTAQKIGISVSELRRILRSKKLKPSDITPETLAELKKAYGKEKANDNPNCANGQNCQRIVAEEELPPLLAKGWHVAAVLPSGKVVVSSD